MIERPRRPDPSFALFGRRGFLTGVGATLLHVTLAECSFPRWASAQHLGDYPFTLGVASGDPTPDGVVLWTRLAPKPLEGGGMPARPVTVQWQLASDERMGRVVRKGAVSAIPELGHSVHIEVDHLKPGTTYWYQFKVGNESSPVGRTRTAPPRGVRDALRFAFVSCQHYEGGFYHALRHVAEEDVDFIVHLGDYIYEGQASGVVERSHLPAHEVTSLEDYRIRYAQYKCDPHLQAVHAAFPWVVTWDDHETKNDYAGYIFPAPADAPVSRLEIEGRRACAYQAYYEHMPLRRSQLPNGPSLQLYRRLAFGDLLSLHVLDTRQYRSDRAPAGCENHDRISGYCPSALDPSRTIAGAAQRAWLLDGLDRSRSTWNVLANQVPFAPNDTNADPSMRTFGGEKWDGYPLDRQKILDFIAARQLVNTVVITGDVHQNFVKNVPPDHLRLDAPPIATEFIGTSITTGGDRTPITVFEGNVNNPHLRFQDNHHGYVRCRLTPDLWQADYRVVPWISGSDDPGIGTIASFVVQKGRAGATRT